MGATACAIPRTVWIKMTDTIIATDPSRHNCPAYNRIRVVGVLTVHEHKPAVVGGVFVPAWVEVRVEE